MSKASLYCTVPGCKNTNITTPDKIFVTIPQGDKEARIKWQRAMGRSNLLAEKTSGRCCEDHFNLEEDMKNYMRFKLMGNVKIKMKPGVVPHIFHCQKEEFVKKQTETKLYESITETGKKSKLSCSTNSKKSVHKSNQSTATDANVHTNPVRIRNKNHKCIQVNIKPRFRSKYNQCNIQVPKRKKQIIPKPKEVNARKE